MVCVKCLINTDGPVFSRMSVNDAIYVASLPDLSQLLCSAPYIRTIYTLAHLIRIPVQSRVRVRRHAITQGYPQPQRLHPIINRYLLRTNPLFPSYHRTQTFAKNNFAANISLKRSNRLCLLGASLTWVGEAAQIHRGRCRGPLQYLHGLVMVGEHFAGRNADAGGAAVPLVLVPRHMKDGIVLFVIDFEAEFLDDF